MRITIKYVKVEDTQSYITKSSTTEISKDSENESNWSKYFSWDSNPIFLIAYKNIDES